MRQALVVLWEAADRICGKRLKAVLPGLIVALERHGHLTSTPRFVSISSPLALPPSIGLLPIRGAAPHRKKRRTKKAEPGDSHPHIRGLAIQSRASGDGLRRPWWRLHGGVFLWSLVATDVCTGWTEAVPLVAREQSLVVEGLEVIRRQFPVPIRGIDSDNDGAFINETLLDYCQEQNREFTRSRAYQKNDQAWIEQKNGAVVRRFVGYQRHAGLVAGQCLPAYTSPCGCL